MAEICLQIGGIDIASRSGTPQAPTMRSIGEDMEQMRTEGYVRVAASAARGTQTEVKAMMATAVGIDDFGQPHIGIWQAVINSFYGTADEAAQHLWLNSPQVTVTDHHNQVVDGELILSQLVGQVGTEPKNYFGAPDEGISSLHDAETGGARFYSFCGFNLQPFNPGPPISDMPPGTIINSAKMAVHSPPMPEGSEGGNASQPAFQRRTRRWVVWADPAMLGHPDYGQVFAAHPLTGIVSNETDTGEFPVNWGLFKEVKTAEAHYPITNSNFIPVGVSITNTMQSAQFHGAHAHSIVDVTAAVQAMVNNDLGRSPGAYNYYWMPIGAGGVDIEANAANPEGWMKTIFDATTQVSAEIQTLDAGGGVMRPFVVVEWTGTYYSFMTPTFELWVSFTYPHDYEKLMGQTHFGERPRRA